METNTKNRNRGYGAPDISVDVFNTLRLSLPSAVASPDHPLMRTGEKKLRLLFFCPAIPGYCYFLILWGFLSK
jgi:hypothetical protein